MSNVETRAAEAHAAPIDKSAPNGRGGLDHEQFSLILQGHVAFQLTAAGVELGVFQRLSERPGLTLEQLAHELGLADQPARILVEGLLAIRLLYREDQGLHNAQLTEEKLVPDHSGSVAPILGWQKHIVYPALVDFIEALRTHKNVGLRHFPGEGNTLYQRLASHPKLESVFHDAMSGISAQAHEALIQRAPVQRWKHLVDLGGGDATNALAFARTYPHLRVTIVDSPTVCAIADEKIAKAGLQARVKTQPGDFFVDALPEGADAVLLAHIVTIWSPEKNERLFAKIRRELPEGGELVVFSMMGSKAEVGPVSTALGSPYFLTIATGEGMLYSWEDYAAWLREAGFAEPECYAGLPFDHGFLIGTR